MLALTNKSLRDRRFSQARKHIAACDMSEDCKQVLLDAVQTVQQGPLQKGEWIALQRGVATQWEQTLHAWLNHLDKTNNVCPVQVCLAKHDT